MELILLDQTFAVCRAPQSDNLLDWASGQLLGIIRTAEECTVICRDGVLPVHVAAQRPWRALRVAGTLDFSQVGIIAEITGLLAGANIPVFVLSTYRTDYFLIKADGVDAAVATLSRAGHTVVSY